MEPPRKTCSTNQMLSAFKELKAGMHVLDKFLEIQMIFIKVYFGFLSRTKVNFLSTICDWSEPHDLTTDNKTNRLACLRGWILT